MYFTQLSCILQDKLTEETLQFKCFQHEKFQNSLFIKSWINHVNEPDYQPSTLKTSLASKIANETCNKPYERASQSYECGSKPPN